MAGRRITLGLAENTAPQKNLLQCRIIQTGTFYAAGNLRSQRTSRQINFDS
jgi:hypothetical protein